MDVSQGSERRAAALSRFRELLGSLERHTDAPRRSVIHIGDDSLPVEPWVRTHVLAGLGFGESPETWEALLSDAVACCARSVADLQRAGSGGEMAAAARDALVLDSALGLCLLDEIDDTVARLAGSDREADARGLGRFREELSEVVSRVGARLNEDALRGAAQADVVRRDSATETNAAEASDDAPCVPTPEMLVRPRQQSHTRILLVALFVAASCWGGMTWWNHLHRAPATPLLTIADFGPVPGVADVAARPPRVFVYMDAPDWLEMTDGDKEALLDRLGGVAAAAGYTGVHLNTPEGRPLGIWLSGSGARALDRTVSVSVPAPATAEAGD